MYFFNTDISIAAIYDPFNIDELAEFTGGSSFFILLKFALVCHLLFMIDYLLF